MNKRGQFLRMMAREARSEERRQRIEETRKLLKSGDDINQIAVRLGVSSNTIRIYIKEIKELERLEKEEEKLKKLEEKKKKKELKRIEKELKNLKKTYPSNYYFLKLRWWLLIFGILFFPWGGFILIILSIAGFNKLRYIKNFREKKFILKKGKKKYLEINCPNCDNLIKKLEVASLNESEKLKFVCDICKHHIILDLKKT